jgi:hypothetical protein
MRIALSILIFCKRELKEIEVAPYPLSVRLVWGIPSSKSLLLAE